MRQNENDSNSTGFSSIESENALKSLRTLSIEPSPFLKTRVLAHAREQRQAKVGFLKKYFLQAGLATCFLFVIAVSFFKNTDSVPSYAVGQDYVIRMDIRPYKDAGVSYAEVVLGDEKVQFSSSKFSEISEANFASGKFIKYTLASAMSSLYKNSRHGVPVPHTTTSLSPRVLASCILRISAGNTCELLRS